MDGQAKHIDIDCLFLQDSDLTPIGICGYCIASIRRVCSSHLRQYFDLMNNHENITLILDDETILDWQTAKTHSAQRTSTDED